MQNLRARFRRTRLFLNQPYYATQSQILESNEQHRRQCQSEPIRVISVIRG